MLNKIALKVLMFMAAGLFGVSPVFAQDLIPDQNKKGKWGYVDSNGKKVIDYNYNDVTAFIDGWAKVRKGNKWGYIGRDGKEVIKIQYSEMLNWADGRCKVAVGGNFKDDVLTGAKWGFINTRGEYLLKPEYDEIGPFKDGLAYVKKGGKYGYIDRSYKFVIPCNFKCIGSFNSKGYCWVGDGKKFGVYNSNGDVVIAPKYKHLGTFTTDVMENNPVMAQIMKSDKIKEFAKKKAKEVSKGLFGKSLLAGLTGDTKSITDEAQKRANKVSEDILSEAEGLVSKENILLMTESPRFDMLGYEFISGELFSELDMDKSDYFAVSDAGYVTPSMSQWTMSVKVLEKIGIIDHNGTVILKPGTYGVAFLPKEGLIPVAKKKGDAYEINYVFESTGKLLMKKWLKATSIAPFTNGMAIVPNGEAQYLIDKNGSRISEEYSLILPPANGIHVVTRNGRFGLLSAEGKEVVPVRNDIIYPEREGLYCIRETSTGTFGYIDATGAYKIPSQFLSAKSFSNGGACVLSDKGWGMIDSEGKSLIDCAWEGIMPYSALSPGQCWVKSDGAWRCLSTETKNYLFDGAYQTVTNFDSDKLAFVSDSENRFGCITTDGSFVIPLALSSQDLAKECLGFMREGGAEKLSMIEAYRYNLLHDPSRHKVRLSHTVDTQLWDY